MDWEIAKEFFKPTKGKIILSFLIPLVLVIFTLAFYYIEIQFVKPDGQIILPQPVESLYPFDYKIIIYTIFASLLNAIILYPFSCSLLVLWNRYKHHEPKRLKGTILILTLIGLIIFNPITLRLIIILGYFVNTQIFLYYNEPCGVIFSSFIPNSPAEKSGMIPEKAIIKINNTVIKDTSDLQEFLRNTKPGDKIVVYTENENNYEVTLDKKPDDNYGFLGIKDVRTKFCKR